MELLIKSVTAEDFGNFYCHAENVFGGMTKMVTLTKREVTGAGVGLSSIDIGALRCFINEMRHLPLFNQRQLLSIARYYNVETINTIDSW